MTDKKTTTKSEIKESTFKTLYQHDFSQDIEEKGSTNVPYLPWASTWAEVKKQFPDASFHKHLFDERDSSGSGVHKVPYLKDNAGFCFVVVTVTIEGQSITDTFPVTNFKNEPYKNPTCSDVYNSQQRALAKCIAFHGFGLRLYNGEEFDGLSDDDFFEDKNKKKPSKPKEPKPSKQKEEIQKVLDDPLMKKITQTFDIESIRGADGMWGSICDAQGNIISGYNEDESTIILDPKDSPDQRLKYINEKWDAIISTITHMDALLRLYTRSFKQDAKVYEKEKKKCCPTGLRHLAFDLGINTNEELGNWEPMKLISLKKAHLLESSLRKEKK